MVSVFVKIIFVKNFGRKNFRSFLIKPIVPHLKPYVTLNITTIGHKGVEVVETIFSKKYLSFYDIFLLIKVMHIPAPIRPN